RVTDAQPREPVSLRKGPQHNDIAVGQGQLQAVGQHAVADVFDVRLVDGDQDVRGYGLHEPGQGVRVDDRGRRVVGVADENQPRAVGDRREHRVEVVRVVGQRHLDGGRTGHLDDGQVALEAAPADHHLVAGRGGDLNQLLAQRDRAATDGDVLGDDIG